VTTDSNGGFSLSVLPVGNYLVSANSNGFAEFSLKTILRVGETTSVDILLSPKGVDIGDVTINGNAAAVDTETQNTGSIISQRLVEDLTARGRNFTEFVSLTPAVVQESERFDLFSKRSRFF
jgi:Carboxypeptidase regulatory-like domain